ncbi:hypothetical protein ACG7TL_004401 [Trametes sanguinea]
MPAAVVSRLTGLPDELQVRIMCEMDPASILACREASPQLKETIDSSIEVHYHLELALSGMIDGPRPPGSACTRDRLAALRAYRAAWDAGKHPIQRVSIDLDKQELHSNSTRHIVYHASNPRGRGGPRRLTVYRPPASFCGIKEHQGDFEGAQELTEDYPYPGMGYVDVQEDLLTYVWRDPDCPYLTDSVHCPCPLRLQYMDLKNDQKLTLLSRTRLAVLDYRTKQPVLHVFSFDPSAASDVGCTLLQDCACTLSLPTRGVDPRFKLTVTPSYDNIARPPSYCYAAPGLNTASAPLFLRDPDLTPLVVRYSGGISLRKRDYLLIIPPDTLNKWYKEKPTQRPVPWEQWGPQGTRMIPLPEPANLWSERVWVDGLGSCIAVYQRKGYYGRHAVRLYEVHPNAFLRSPPLGVAGKDKPPRRPLWMPAENKVRVPKTTRKKPPINFEDPLSTSYPTRKTFRVVSRERYEGGDGIVRREVAMGHDGLVGYQGTTDVKANEASETQPSSGTILDHVPSPIRRPGFTAHNRKAVEKLAQVDADSAFFADHLRACPEHLVKAIEQRNDVQGWIAEIQKVRTKEDRLYQPVADFLTMISEKIFDYLQTAEGKEKLHLPPKPIVFLDHHSHAPTHFPVGRVDDKPDIIGAVGRDGGYPIANDGSYERVPYHCIETVVEAKTIYGNGQAQATRYAFNIQQARPDRPGFYCLSVKPGMFQVVYSSPVGVEVSEHKAWSDCVSLCAYVYSLYDPPDGHILYDRTIVAKAPAGVPLGKPTWTIQTEGGIYSGAVIIFLGDPWGRRTTVFRITRRERSVIIKESYIDCSRRYDEVELLKRVHEHGYLPGVVRFISAEDIKNGDKPIVLKKKDGSLTRKKRRIVLADLGQDLNLAGSVNDLLMAIYDVLEVHRTLARERQILHRDMSLFNLLMYPTSAPCAENEYFKDAPPLIDDILQGELRSPAKRKARCLIIDLDNAANLVGAKADTVPEELQCRTGTPAYIARSVAGGVLFTTKGNLSWPVKMPALSDEAKVDYVKLHGEERYNRYEDTPETVHGGVPPKETQLQTSRRAKAMRFYHRWEYDAESVFWTMYAALLRVVPRDSPKESEQSQKKLNKNWRMLNEHIIPSEREAQDTRNPLLEQDFDEVAPCFLPAMQPVAQLVADIALHVYPSYAVMTPPPPHDDHLHEAMQRLILDYLVMHRDNPIPLIPGRLRPVEFGNSPVTNLGSYGGSMQEQGTRGEKRQRAPTDGTQMVRRLTRDSASQPDDPAVFGDRYTLAPWKRTETDQD